MQLTRRIIAAVLMVAAVLGVLAALAGIVSVWVVKARWTAQAAAVMAGLSADLQSADGALLEIGPRLAAGRDGLGAISVTAGGVGEKLGQPRVVELAQGVQGRLGEIDGKVQEVNDRLNQVQAGVNNLVQLANRLPGVEVPALDVNVLDGVSSLLSEADGRLQDLADEVTGGKVTVTQEMNGIEQTVQQIRGDMEAAESAVATAAARLDAARIKLATWSEQLPAMLERTAWLLTAGLLWFIVGQVGLLMWMWSVYRRASGADEAA